MRVLMVEPGKEPFVTEIGNNLESLQKAVDGHIEVLYLDSIGICILAFGLSR